MLKKYSIIALFLFAYTIVFAHSIVPHHHHDEEHDTEQSSNHHNEHDNDHHDSDHHNKNNDDNLAHDFEKYIHASGSDDVYQKNDFKIDHNTIATVYLFTAFHFQINVVEDPPSVVSLSGNCIPLVQHYLSSKGLRAPPIA